MTKGFKLALIGVLSAYFFSLGLWIARGHDIWSRHQNLKSQIITLNELSQKKKEVINSILAQESSTPEITLIAKHLRAIEQLTPHYDLETALIKIEENQKLATFSDGFIFVMKDFLPAEQGALVAELQTLDFKIKEQQKSVQKALFLP